MAIESAEEQVLNSIAQMLVTQDNNLLLPLTTLNKATADLVQKNAKLITRMQDKILRSAAKLTTANDDVLDSVTTRVLGGLDAWQFDVRYLLTQLATKGGAIEMGEPLEAALEQEVLKAPELAYAGTLVLAVKEAVPWLERIAVALEIVAMAFLPQAINNIEERDSPEEWQEVPPTLEPLEGGEEDTPVE